MSTTYISGSAASAAATANTWALEDCGQQVIDLVFVADAFVVSSYNDRQERNCWYDKQMGFFSELVDIFGSLTGTQWNTRVRVCLLVASQDAVTGAPVIEERKEVGACTDKKAIKTIIRHEQLESKDNTAPMQAIPYVREKYANRSGGLRKNTTLVIVMFGGHQNLNLSYSESDLYNDLNIADDVEAKLFMLVLKDLPPDRLKLTPRVAIYKISDIHEDLSKTAAILMCNTCFCDWFRASYNTPALISSIDATCYKLCTAEKTISWVDAAKLCRNISSHLVSVETEDELVSLRKQLNPQIEDILDHEHGAQFVNVYIGLRRMKSTIGKRFRWVNDRPLVYSEWANSEPQGGAAYGCVVWKLSHLSHNVSLTEQDNNSDKPLSSGIKGTWSTTICGDAVSKYYLCEDVVNLPMTSPPHNTEKFQLAVPSYESIKDAIGRGELGLMTGSNLLMSLSHLLKIWKSKGPIVEGYAYNNHDMNQTVALSEVKLYHCEGNDGKVPYTSVCDYARDCPYFADEAICRTCSIFEKECRINRQCIQAEYWCDMVSDCQDKTDEINCDACSHGLCADGRCLVKSWFADDEVDCSGCGASNSSYEMEYVQANNISYCLFTCNRTECVFETMLNDSFLNCQGPEGPIDETIGSLEATKCYPVSHNQTYPFSNWAPRCVYIKDIYGELLGCRNLRHLQGCKSFICPEGYYKCHNYYCIPTHYILDGNMDCPHGDDEIYDMQFLKCPFHFMCHVTFPVDSFLCLHPDLVCDGRIDCPEGDDELNCFVTCLEGFQCLAGTMVVSDFKKTKSTKIIPLIHPSIRYLDLSGINLSTIFPSFFRNGDINLMDVRMSGCSIVSTFMSVPICKLGTIRRIDLSRNKITNITSNSVFRCMNNLYSLNLSYNDQLTSIEGIEYEISKVKYLDLSYTRLATLSRLTLSFLNDLKYLNLRNTFITDVRFLPPTRIEVLDLRKTKVNNLPYANMFKHVIISLRLFTNSFKLCCPQLHNASTNMSACMSTKDPFSSCSDLMSNLALRIILWVDGILAILGNLAVIIYRVFFDRSIFTMAYGHFVTHLGVSDLLMGVYLAIIAIADSYYRDVYVWEEITWRNSVICKISGFLSTLSIEVSTLFIVLITLDRFMVIRYPFGQFRIVGKAVTACCAVTWLLGSLIAIFPLLPFFDYLNVYNTNGVCLGLPLTNKRHSGREFAIAVFIFFNFFMFILIACGQLVIYRTVSIMRMNQSSITNSNSRRCQELAVAKNVSMVAITNFLCWFPIGVMGIMVQFGYTIGVEAYAWSAVLILPINSAINPLLYTVPAVTRKFHQFKEKMSSERSKHQ